MFRGHLMDSCATVIMVVIVVAAALFALFLILLSLPKSRLRYFLLEMMGWGTAGVSTILFVSPIDLLPLIPLEDPAYLLMALAGGVTGFIAHKERRELDS